ncbi:MAG: tRNA pseudouridine(55) synthase TruB [Clostridia bacterium]|nr:tRNA pseudouridine(55) synthase TruB [Clostridia bacterium]
MNINGILLINKERGMSSNKVVNKVKYLVGAEKAGHLGTLDVLGEGLLPITLGKSTKLFDYFLNKDKVYKTIFKFGETTATLDLEGEVIQRNDVQVSMQMLKQIIPQFVGRQSQMPPQYSAKKINGQKAYDLARKGEDVSLKPKEIEIYSIKVCQEVEDNTFELEVHCSSGTYIRSLCRDMATQLSTFGVMRYIQRAKCGCFDIKDAYTIKQVEQKEYTIISPDKVFDLQSIFLDETERELLLNGVIIKSKSQDGEYKVFQDSVFLGIGEVCQGRLKLKLRLI